MEVGKNPKVCGCFRPNAYIHVFLCITDPRKCLSQSSWPKLVMKKWLNIKSSADEFHSDYTVNGKITVGYTV